VEENALTDATSKEEDKEKPKTTKRAYGGGVAAVIDMHSSSNAQLVLAEAWHMHIPIVDALKGSKEENATITIAERVIATQIYAVHVLSRLGSRDVEKTSAKAPAAEAASRKKKKLTHTQRLDMLLNSPKEFARNLYRSRYEGLYPQGSLFMQQQLKEFNCYRVVDLDADAGADKEKENEDNRSIIRSVVEKLDHRLIESHAQFVADAFHDPSLDTEHAGVRITWLQNYIERLAFWAMGGDYESSDDSRTGLFLLQCLYQGEFLNIVPEVEGGEIHLSDFTEA
jgi:hypothetical protein